MAPKKEMNMKLRIVGLTGAVLFAVIGATANAASQDECAIWICLPGGFPSGCGAAHSAMKDRIKDRKPPLPPFSSCAVSYSGGESGGEMSFDYGIAAYIPAHRECSGDGMFSRCSHVPEQYVRGRICHSDWSTGTRSPEYCAKTVRWSEVFVDGELAGPTYYW
jgi:hypothetical protein